MYFSSALFTDAAKQVKQGADLGVLARALARALANPGRDMASTSFQANESRSLFAVKLEDGVQLLGCVGPRKLDMKLVQNEKHYAVSLPLNGSSLEDLQVVVTASSVPESEPAVFCLNGAAFFKGTGVPETFAELHARMVDVVTQRLSWVLALKPASVCEEAQAGPQEEEPLIEILVPRSNGRTLKFTGRELGRVTSTLQRGRYWELAVYRTQGGKLVAQRIGRSRWPTESDQHTAEVFDSPEEVQQFLGDSPVAQALYSRVGFDYFELVD